MYRPVIVKDVIFNDEVAISDEFRASFLKDIIAVGIKT
jgi:hypothetical protein